MNETSTLIAESRKIVEAAHSDTLEPNVLLNMVLQIVTNIDKRIEIMETTMIKSVDDLKGLRRNCLLFQNTWVHSQFLMGFVLLDRR